MITFLDLIQKSEFRDFVANRIASSIGETYNFPIVFPKLYRYRSLSKYSIDDIIKCQLTLSSIGEFNDIFDGAIHQYGSKEEIEKKAEAHWNEYDELLKGFPSARSILKRDTIIENSKRHFKTESRLKFRELDYLGTYVCCFSEENTSTLMWSHYADSNKGICIEYDFNTLNDDNLIRNSVFPIAYTESPIKVTDLLEDEKNKIFQYPIDAAVLCSALNKAKVWCYEKEWRMVSVLTSLGEEIQRKQIQLPIKPSKVYLGYHFLKPFFYYKSENQLDKDKRKSQIQEFMKLIDYLKNNQIPVAVMVPFIGSYNFKPCDITIDALESFMKQHFENRQLTSIHFYYTLHDRLLDLLEK